METFSASVSLLQLCQIVGSTSLKLHRTYRSVQGCPKTLQGAFLDCVIQSTRWHLWHTRVDQQFLPESLRDIVSRIEHGIEEVLREIKKLLSKYDLSLDTTGINPPNATLGEPGGDLAAWS